MESRAKLFGHAIPRGTRARSIGVGMDEGAHLNAPNSLSGRPARG